MDGIELRPRLNANGSVAATERGWQLRIGPGNNKEYRLAQLDDHAGRPRSEFSWRAPLRVSLRARVSSPSIPGTWGFGMWNDPFGLACSPIKDRWRFPVPPQAAWFFSASPRSYLSLRNDMPANGLFAQVFKSPRGGCWLTGAVLTLPFDARGARRRLSHQINEDASAVESDPCAWHEYEIRWRRESTEFSIDRGLLLKSEICPVPPLGIVIWIDNQYAAFDPRGRLAWGVECNPNAVWLDVEDVSCGSDPGAG